MLGELRAFPEVAADELRRRAPFMGSSALLRAAVSAGADRSGAHAIVQRHSLAASDAQRSGGSYDLASALGADGGFPLTADEVVAVLEDAVKPGRAAPQVTAFQRAAAELLDRHPAAGKVVPEPIL